jgi:hypothetical protein
VDCVTVSAAPLKGALDDQFQHAQDSLVLALRRQLAAGLKAVETYLETGTDKMSTRPSSLQEIAKSQKECVLEAEVPCRLVLLLIVTPNSRLRSCQVEGPC